MFDRPTRNINKIRFIENIESIANILEVINFFCYTLTQMFSKMFSRPQN